MLSLLAIVIIASIVIIITKSKQVVMLAGLAPLDHPTLRPSTGELDEERKQELIMEKRLRACRVSIRPKVGKRKIQLLFSFSGIELL